MWVRQGELTWEGRDWAGNGRRGEDEKRGGGKILRERFSGEVRWDEWKEKGKWKERRK